MAVPTARGRRARATPCGRSSPPARPSSRARASTWAASRRRSASTGPRCSAGSATATRCSPRCCGRSPSRRSSRPRPRRADAEGAARVVAACSRTSSTTSSPPTTSAASSQREPARALRLLTTKESEIQRRYVAVVEALVRQRAGRRSRSARAIDRARPRLPAGPHLGVVHLRRPHQRRPAERGARARGLRRCVLRADEPYPHTAARSRTRWNDNDVYGHLNNTVYYEAMDTTINVWMIGDGGPRPAPAAARSASACRRRASSRRPPSFPEPLEVGLRAEPRRHVERHVGARHPARGEASRSPTGRFVHVFVDDETAPARADPRRRSAPRSSATWSSDPVAYRPGGMTTCRPGRGGRR